MERYWLIGGGALLAVLLVASVALALGRGEDTLAPNSPEYAVQSFLRAIESRDFAAADSLRSSELLRACPPSRYPTLDMRGSLDELDDSRITLSGVETMDEISVVTVIQTVRGGGVFSSYEWDDEHRYALRREDGAWRIDAYVWPYDECVWERFESSDTLR